MNILLWREHDECLTQPITQFIRIKFKVQPFDDHDTYREIVLMNIIFCDRIKKAKQKDNEFSLARFVYRFVYNGQICLQRLFPF